MRREQIARLAEFGVTIDFETDRIQTGLLAPPLVLGAIARCANPTIDPADAQSQIEADLLFDETGSATPALEAFRWVVESDDLILIGANIAFDILVGIVEWAKRGVNLIPAVFRMFEQGRVYDVLLGETLNAIADGYYNKDPRTGGEMRDKKGRTTNRMSLFNVVKFCLGREDAKVNDIYVETYHQFRGVPRSQLPPEARDYPVDDVRNTHEAALAQAGLVYKRANHQWHTIVDESGEELSTCRRCGNDFDFNADTDCWIQQPHRNLHAMSDEVYTAFALHVGAAWGFRVNQESVNAVEKEVVEKRAKIAIPLIDKKLLKWKKEKGITKLGRDTGAIARWVSEAFGVTGTCQSCQGTGKVPSAKNPKSKINCHDCRATGLDMDTATSLVCTEPSNRFPNGQVKAGRDVLYESGDDTLRELAEWLEDAKVVTSYIPFLRTAQITVMREDGQVITYPRPLTLRPNTILANDRVSYDGVIQLFPRSGNLRSCIEARPNFRLVSTDWNQGELVTHGQSCLWILGHSDLANVMNSGADPHAGLAATVLGIAYHEFDKKIKAHKDARQGSKPWNFGRPGGMGVPKLVASNREKGADTPCENGPVWIDDGTGNNNKIRGYKGTRFCILMAGAPRCGVNEDGSDNKVTLWGRRGNEREIPPTCKACLDCGVILEENYFSQWSEARDYFRYTTSVMDEGQPLTDWQCEVLGLEPGSSTAPGEQVQHVSNIIRACERFTDLSNGYFSSLLAVAAKMAFRQAQRECMDPSFVVPTEGIAPIDKKTGKVTSAYAGQVSPLYGSRAIVLQHDEILSEILDTEPGQLHHGAMRQSEIMVWALQTVCPDMIDAVRAPAAASQQWLKEAEPLIDPETGYLIPWTKPVKAGNTTTT